MQAGEKLEKIAADSLKRPCSKDEDIQKSADKAAKSVDPPARRRLWSQSIPGPEGAAQTKAASALKRRRHGAPSQADLG
jgi:hypothetical protein